MNGNTLLNRVAYLLLAPLALGTIFGCLQLGAAAALPLHFSIAAWVGFAFIYWFAFELSGHAVAWAVRPWRVPFLVVLIVAALIGKIVGRPIMLEYGELFLPFLGAPPTSSPKPYSQFTAADIVHHLWNNLPLMVSWVGANLYFRYGLGLRRLGFGPAAPAARTGLEDRPAVPDAVVAPVAEPVETQPRRSPSGIAALARALPEEILALSAEDHYVRVHLRNGRTALIFYRLATALAEFAEEDGIRVHRSHWVRRSAITLGSDLGRSGRLRLITGAEIPVSHAYLQLVRQAGLFHRTDREPDAVKLSAAS